MRLTRLSVVMLVACGGDLAPTDAAIDAPSDGGWAANELVCVARTDAIMGVRHVASCTDYEGPSSPASCAYGERDSHCPDGAVARCDYSPGADGTTLVQMMYPPIDLGAARSLCTTGTFTEL